MARLGPKLGKECWVQGQCERLGQSSGPRLKYGWFESLDRQNSVKMTEMEKLEYHA